ncbi:MAG: hypothetical protein JXR76_16170 [Deltaproteobacteria bacterium]|nr:hypothetical protein [Deltaproteobacteria bacterium]
MTDNSMEFAFMSADKPTLKEFLAAPVEEIVPYAPATMFWAVEGTRRSAALAGFDILHKDEKWVTWSIQRMLECAGILFQHGVRHVMMPYLHPSQFSEATPGYRENIIRWVSLLITNPAVKDALRNTGWRVRLIGDESELGDISKSIAEEMSPSSAHTLWFLVIEKEGALWQQVFDAVLRTGAHTLDDAICAIYGEHIPQATLLLSFGKPIVSTDQLPPLLIGKMNCYWSQKPGYRLTERDFRTVLYDAAFIRKTWTENKLGRAELARKHQDAWENGAILGLGVRLGPHWYPAPYSAPISTGS